MWGQEGRALRVSTPTSSAEGLLPQASSMPVFPSACWLCSEWGLGREEEALLSLRPLTMAGRAPSQEFRDGTLSSKQGFRSCAPCEAGQGSQPGGVAHLQSRRQKWQSQDADSGLPDSESSVLSAGPDASVSGLLPFSREPSFQLRPRQ